LRPETSRRQPRGVRSTRSPCSLCATRFGSQVDQRRSARTATRHASGCRKVIFTSGPLMPASPSPAAAGSADAALVWRHGAPAQVGHVLIGSWPHTRRPPTWVTVGRHTVMSGVAASAFRVVRPRPPDVRAPPAAPQQRARGRELPQLTWYGARPVARGPAAPAGSGWSPPQGHEDSHGPSVGAGHAPGRGAAERPGRAGIGVGRHWSLVLVRGREWRWSL